MSVHAQIVTKACFYLDELETVMLDRDKIWTKNPDNLSLNPHSIIQVFFGLSDLLYNHNKWEWSLSLIWRLTTKQCDMKINHQAPSKNVHPKFLHVSASCSTCNCWQNYGAWSKATLAASLCLPLEMLWLICYCWSALPGHGLILLNMNKDMYLWMQLLWVHI